MNEPFDFSLILVSAAILALIVLSALFSGSETALTSASRAKLRAQADKGSKGAARALSVTENSEQLIGAILLGNNFVNILATALATAWFTRLFGESGVALATLVMTIMVLVFAEVLPKTYAINNPESTATRAAPIIVVLIWLSAWPVAIVRFVVRVLLRGVGIYLEKDSAASVRDEIAGAIALGHSSGTVEKEDRDRLLGALDLNDRNVLEIMRHRSEIEMIDADAPINTIVNKACASAYSRLPVFQDKPDNIVGVLHTKDLLRALDKIYTSNEKQDINAIDIATVIRKPYFIPETTPLDKQIRQFLRQRAHFALVVDEYGSWQGLITLEDILEEIVGEITDEFDVGHKIKIHKAKNGDLIVDGAMTIRDLNRECDWSLPDEVANTIAGLVIHEAQTIPTRGQVFSFHGFRFEVIERQENRLTKLKIRHL